MLDDRNYIKIELLFNQLVVELEFRRTTGHVPKELPEAINPEFFPLVIGTWWDFYHESRAVRMLANRTTWVRHPDYPSRSSMNNEELSSSLLYIGQLIDMELIAGFREVKEGEMVVFLLTKWLAEFYQSKF